MLVDSTLRYDATIMCADLRRVHGRVSEPNNRFHDLRAIVTVREQANYLDEAREAARLLLPKCLSSQGALNSRLMSRLTRLTSYVTRYIPTEVPGSLTLRHDHLSTHHYILIT
jgi:hypothetical protein